MTLSQTYQNYGQSRPKLGTFLENNSTLMFFFYKNWSPKGSLSLSIKWELWKTLDAKMIGWTHFNHRALDFYFYWIVVNLPLYWPAGWSGVYGACYSAERPINGFKPVQHSRRKALRANCPNIYTVDSGPIRLSMTGRKINPWKRPKSTTIPNIWKNISKYSH